MAKLIDDPINLIDLDREALDELLLEKYKNSGLLRELTRRCLISLKEQTELTNFYKENPDSEQLENIKNEINQIFDKYK